MLGSLSWSNVHSEFPNIIIAFGNKVSFNILTHKSAVRFSVKIYNDVLPCHDMPAQTCTFKGCFTTSIGFTYFLEVAYCMLFLELMLCCNYMLVSWQNRTWSQFQFLFLFENFILFSQWALLNKVLFPTWYLSNSIFLLL